MNDQLRDMMTKLIDESARADQDAMKSVIAMNDLQRDRIAGERRDTTIGSVLEENNTDSD